jgi:hypothetical protein
MLLARMIIAFLRSRKDGREARAVEGITLTTIRPWRREPFSWPRWAEFEADPDDAEPN